MADEGKDLYPVRPLGRYKFVRLADDFAFTSCNPCWGAKAVGIEYKPDMVALSKKNAAAAGLGGKATFIQGDMFKSDFHQATVITMFLPPDINLRLRPILLDMKRGLVSCRTLSIWRGEYRTRRSPPPANAKAIAGPCCGSSPPRWMVFGRCRGAI